MQQVSEAYKTEQKQHLREKSYVWVYLGIVDRSAQKAAKIDNSTPVTSWSKVPTGNDVMEGFYATYEQNFFRADGSMMFPPNGAWGTYQGAASASLGGAIKFSFGTTCNIRGISLTFFDDAIPLSFTISNGSVSNTYTYSTDDVDEHGIWSCEDEYSNSDYIMITPLSLKGGNQRFRIQKILFGVGFHFANKDILSTSYTHSVAHLSDKLPSKSFTFTIDNTSKRFAADDPHSFVHFLQEQQEVEFDYGRDLPDGTIETIKGGKVYLKSWSTDDQKATFNAVGYLDYMDSIYYKGDFNMGVEHIEPSLLYDLAVDVLEDAGITNYNVDTALQDDYYYETYCPLPLEKHKNLLQLIANAGRCILYEDRDGTITIEKPHGVQDYSLEYSDLLSPPTAITTEFVKNVICNAYNFTRIEDRVEIGVYDCEEGENIITFSDTVIVDGIGYKDIPRTISNDITTGMNMPEGASFNFTIEHGAYAFGGSWYENTGYNSDSANGNTYTLSVVDVDGHIYKTENNVNSISYTNNAGWTIEGLKIRVEYPWYQCLQEHQYQKGAHYVKFNLSAAMRIVILGRKYEFFYEPKTDNIRSVGVDKTCNNPLITVNMGTLNQRTWMANYYNNDVEYTIDYRGEPALDCDDVILLENNYVAKNYIRVTETNINTSQGMSKCTLKARRISWKDFARVDFAEVDDSEVK